MRRLPVMHTDKEQPTKGFIHMNKVKRIIALTGALFCLYMSTLIFALIGSPVSTDLFKASLAATIIIPVLLYGYILTARVLAGKGADRETHRQNSDEKTDTSKDG